MTTLKLSTLALLGCYVSPIIASSPPPLIAVGTEAINGKSAINHSLNAIGTTFLAADEITLSFDLHIAEEDIGIQSELYLVAKTAEQSYIRTADNLWQLWSEGQPFIATKSLKLQAEERLEVLKGDTLPVGEYLVYAAYKTGSGEIKYNASPSSLIVFAENAQALHLVTQPEILHDYLYQGAIHRSPYFYHGGGLVFADDFSGTTSETGASTTGNKTSGTTLQEDGVDESDRMKTDNNLLFSLRDCDADKQQSCLHSYQLQDSPAEAKPLSHLQLTKQESKQNFYSSKRLGELYLNLATETQSRSLIWLNAHNSWQIIPTDYPEWISYEKQIELKFISASDPEKLSETHKLKLDGQLLSSRLVDGVLYLLSTHSTWHFPPYDTKPQNIKPPLDFFLPHYQLNDSQENKPLVESSQCYIPPQNNAHYNQATLSVITAIPVNNPSALQSRCIAGELDTFYASPNAIYFSTSRYPYTMLGNQFVYDAPQEHVTDIHKFSLKSADMEYLGSGKVEGHLGWEQDKKSFRFGEFNNTLRVATSAGSNWGTDSRTKVTVLEEDSDSHSLKEISSIDNLGKPGERLYAARFVGNRGYLVTFRITDPLIVIDFSQPEKPEVIGELEINGYSDYLQPLGDNYLLGIGKDAIADEQGGGDFRGAWYQGVKLSLFDVSSAENLREVNSVILGKRGTNATVLSDHHGLAMLKTGDNQYTIALPVEMHDSFNKPSPSALASPPSTYYNWTHTGLYVFDINTGNTPSLDFSGKLITESSNFIDVDTSGSYDFINDRAVIQNNSVHYIHGDQILSSEIADLE